MGCVEAVVLVTFLLLPLVRQHVLPTAAYYMLSVAACYCCFTLKCDLPSLPAPICAASWGCPAPTFTWQLLPATATACFIIKGVPCSHTHLPAPACLSATA